MAKQKETKATQKKEAKKASPKKEEPKKTNYVTYIAVVAVILAIVALIYYVGTNYISTSFATFKANFISVPRVALTIGYSNTTQFSQMNPCFINMIQYIAHTRNASTIDFFIINQANATCLYSSTGLGHPISGISTQSAGKCLSVANSEPSVFLNFSATNSTAITLSHLYVFGNSGYMAKCPIAQELG